MAFVKITNDAVDTYPYTIGQLRRDNPNTSFPRNIDESVLNEWGVYSVTSVDAPSYTEATQKVEEVDPVLSDGVWTQTWQVTSKSDEEVATHTELQKEKNRHIRDIYLTETDWWAVSDRTMTAEQTSYRQALRDITTHANWPYLNDDDWPTKP